MLEKCRKLVITTRRNSSSLYSRFTSRLPPLVRCVAISFVSRAVILVVITERGNMIRRGILMALTIVVDSTSSRA